MPLTYDPSIQQTVMRLDRSELKALITYYRRHVQSPSLTEEAAILVRWKIRQWKAAL